MRFETPDETPTVEFYRALATKLAETCERFAKADFRVFSPRMMQDIFTLATHDKFSALVDASPDTWTHEIVASVCRRFIAELDANPTSTGEPTA